ncbi:MAG TPA: glycine cleavage system aminomethyltransferase GcvT [Limnochordales bacterium]
MEHASGMEETMHSPPPPSAPPGGDADQPARPLHRTPLASLHERSGARMVAFAGWWMPLSYASIVQEHLAVRQAVGLFDVSHMGRLWVRGPEAARDLDRLLTIPVAAMAPGQARYGLLCLPSGGILDDLVVLRLGPEEFLLVVNAACREKDLAWLEQHLAGSSTVVEDRTMASGLLALQGPRAEEVLADLAQEVDLARLGFYRFAQGRIAGRPVLISRTGYTGEDGFELLCEAEAACELWELLAERACGAGGSPAGLGARDTLRLEARYLLYGQDMDETTTPLEAGLDWAVDFGKGDFVGRFALAQQREQGVLRQLVGFALQERAVPRHGYPLLDDSGQRVGEVTSGTLSPVLQQPIGLGYVVAPCARPQTPLAVEVRGRPVPGRVVEGPFVPLRTRARGGSRKGPAAPR